MNFYIDIEKKQIIKEATKMTIKVSNIELNSSAIIKIELYDNIYNLLDTNQTPVLGFTAYKTLITQLNGISLPPMPFNYTTGVEAHRFNRGGSVVEVVFAIDNTTKTITVPQSKFIRAIDRDGKPFLPTFANGNAQINVGFSPIYIHRTP